MYKYWTSFESEEHCLYPWEVAKFYQVYSCSSARGDYLKHNDVLMNELLKESSDELGKEAIYYETKTGLKRVFDHETINHAIQSLRSRYETDGAVLYCPVNNKRYKFVFKEKNVLPALKQLFPEWFEEDGSKIHSPVRSYDRKEELKNRKKAKA